MILCNLSRDASRSTSYSIISVLNSFFIDSGLTTLLIVVASTSLTMLQLFCILEVTSSVMSWLTTNFLCLVRFSWV
ncbi:BgTH12-02767 [Blumeria graminis f. sp. triticale]|uniref:BgTH12-02767 n=1 Tax=Blumeria graminis f. sp. triticale TaxID=1689686 RepID=A0A9W4D2R4_BLUGR|nr:BgTH12-02767 [Blumeria graminis f. sp. triticale]